MLFVLFYLCVFFFIPPQNMTFCCCLVWFCMFLFVLCFTCSYFDLAFLLLGSLSCICIPLSGAVCLTQYPQIISYSFVFDSCLTDLDSLHRFKLCQIQGNPKSEPATKDTQHTLPPRVVIKILFSTKTQQIAASASEHGKKYC